MYHRIIVAAYHWILAMINVQLFMTLISLPICTAWGIPLSMLTILGNLLFSPFLTVYIFISSLLFITLFFSYACRPLCWLLDQCTTIWIMTLKYMPSTIYFGFPRSSLFLLIITALIAVYIAYTSHYTKLKKCFA